MRIAVTYDCARVFAHFGKTEVFAIYDIKEGNITSRELYKREKEGHSAIGDMLKSLGVNVVICGGIGEPAVNKLKSLSIEVYPGVSGFTDDAVIAFLNGSLNYSNAGIHKCHHSN